MANAIQFWLPINKETWSDSVNDSLSGGPVIVPMGCALQFNLAFSRGVFADANILDLSNYSEIVFELLAPDLSEVLISKSIASGNFQSCTVAEFNAFTAQQLSVFIPSAQNILTTTAGATGNFILTLYGVDNDAVADIDILCSFQISTKATGVTLNPGSPIPLNWGSYIPFFCSDGNTRNLSLVKLPNNQWTFQIGAPYEGPGVAAVPILCADNLVRTLSLTNDSGEWTTVVNQNGVAS